MRRRARRTRPHARRAAERKFSRQLGGRVGKLSSSPAALLVPPRPTYMSVEEVDDRRPAAHRPPPVGTAEQGAHSVNSAVAVALAKEGVPPPTKHHQTHTDSRRTATPPRCYTALQSGDHRPTLGEAALGDTTRKAAEGHYKRASAAFLRLRHAGCQILRNDDFNGARKDVAHALQLHPEYPEALQLRKELAAYERRLVHARRQAAIVLLAVIALVGWGWVTHWDWDTWGVWMAGAVAVCAGSACLLVLFVFLLLGGSFGSYVR